MMNLISYLQLITNLMELCLQLVEVIVLSEFMTNKQESLELNLLVVEQVNQDTIIEFSLLSLIKMMKI